MHSIRQAQDWSKSSVPSRSNCSAKARRDGYQLLDLDWQSDRGEHTFTETGKGLVNIRCELPALGSDFRRQMQEVPFVMMHDSC